MSDANVKLFETTAEVLLYCWIFGFLLLLASFGIFRLTRSFTQRLHGGIFGLSAHELDLIFYCGMGLLKLGVILFFFIPWLAIHVVLG